MALFEAVAATIRRLHYSPRAAPRHAALRWIREFIRFHNRRHPREMLPDELTAFLNDLAVRRRSVGRNDPRTSMIDTHIVDRGPLGVVSPLRPLTPFARLRTFAPSLAATAASPYSSSLRSAGVSAESCARYA